MSARTMFITNDPNNLQRIAETNYWESEYAEAGVFYFSVCAGCIRMLMPERQGGLPLGIPGQKLDDSVFDTTKYVVVSRGDYGGILGYEVLFEDETDTPFVIQTSLDQWSQLLPVGESGRIVPFHVYRNGCVLVREFEGRYRYVGRLPYLKPWDANASAITPIARPIVEAAGLAGIALQRPYPGEMPPDLAPFHVYVPDQGHCLIVVAGQYGTTANPGQSLLAYPVKAVLRVGYTIRDGLVWCDMPYDSMLGAVALADEHEF